MRIISSSKVVHFSIRNQYLRFVIATKKGALLDYGQKCLPPEVITEGNITDREVLSMILEEIIDRWKLKGSRMSFSVPNDSIIVRKISVPLEIRDDELTGYLYMQLGDTVHLPFENPVLASVPLAEYTDNQKDVLLIAANETIVADYVQLFEEASLKPYLADLSMLSLYRTYYHLGLAHPEEHELFIQISLTTMVFSVFHQHKPVLVNHVPLSFTLDQFEVVHSRSGAEYYTWNDSQDMLVGYIRDAMMDIERFLTYYRFNLSQNKYGITKIFVTGDHPSMKTFVTQMKERLNVEVQSFLEPLFQTKKGVNIPPVYSECIGLSLK